MKRLLFFFALFYSLNLYAQSYSPQDCPGGIPVCHPFYAQLAGLPGYGQYDEIPQSYNGPAVNDPCDDWDFEESSMWYIITVHSPGLISFTITPLPDPYFGFFGADVDFAVWDITNTGCSALFDYSADTAMHYDAIRCNVSENGLSTGLSSSACCAEEDVNGPPFSSSIQANAGQVFALCIYQFTTLGFTIDFSASTANIYDTTTLPNLDSIGTLGTFCHPADSITFQMSEGVECTSIDADGSNFRITPALGVPISEAGPGCAGPNTYSNETSTSITLKFPAQLPPGHYVLHAQNGHDGNTLINSCGNAEAVGDSIAFDVLAPLPSVTMPVKTTCVSAPIQLDVAVPDSFSYNYSWSPATYLNNANIFNPIADPTAIGDIAYIVSITPTATDCHTFDTVKLHVLPDDFVLYNHDSTLCIGTTIQINVSGDTAFTYTWVPVIGISNPNIIDPSIMPNASGVYTITASYPGCPDMSHQLAYTVENPIANIITPDSTVFCISDSVQLSASAEPDTLSYTYAWMPGTGLADTTVLQPVFFENTGGSYTYYLTVTTPLGCENTDSVLIMADNCKTCMWAPSGFTPNGDGKNDVFHVVGVCPLSNYHIVIENRWGQIMFDSYDISKGWDGTFGGIACDVGTYFYFITSIPNVDGITGERSFRGSVTLIR